MSQNEYLSQLPTVEPPGRPIGTTEKMKRNNEELFERTKNDIVGTWCDKTKRPKDIKLQDFIDQKVQESGLDKTPYKVTINMLHSRMRRDRLLVTGTGQISPALPLEPRLVLLIKLSTDCNNEMTKEEILDFANSYLEGSELEKDIVLWKVVHHAKFRNEFVATGEMPKRCLLGNGWFAGFINRWKDEIQYKPSTNVAVNQTEHCTYEYEKFAQMYDNVYDLFIKDGYAVPMIDPKFYNNMGEECEENDVDRFGEREQTSYSNIQS